MSRLYLFVTGALMVWNEAYGGAQSFSEAATLLEVSGSGTTEIGSEQEWKAFFRQHTYVFNRRNEKIPAPKIPINFETHRLLVIHKESAGLADSVEVRGVDIEPEKIRVHYAHVVGQDFDPRTPAQMNHHPLLIPIPRYPEKVVYYAFDERCVD
ncbi:MAG: hypothetical protein JNL01_03025 [Bdellovibrionales bacterium]|nr:hypothetical protein [Bdellovibrionales bacterium]